MKYHEISCYVNQNESHLSISRVLAINSFFSFQTESFQTYK